MKKEIDKDGRIIYKYGHSLSKGGNLYTHKASEGIITNKAGLRNALNAIVLKHKLIDATIKIYDDIFFLFFSHSQILSASRIN